MTLLADPPAIPATTDKPIECNRIDVLERAIVDNLPLLDLEPVHRFAKGIYARELTIPAGCVLSGKIHKTQHLNIISKGRIVVFDEAEGMREISAPFSFIAEPGARRAGFALEDTVWTTVHATDETDLDRLEAQLIQKYENPLLALRQMEAK